MKKSILPLFILSIIFLNFSTTYSQWILRSPYPTVNDVYDFHAFKTNNIIGAVSYTHLVVYKRQVILLQFVWGHVSPYYLIFLYSIMKKG